MCFASEATSINIIAHRGRSDGLPENTLRAFRGAIHAGASGFECDLRLSKDQQPIIIHTRYGSDDVKSLLSTDRPLSSLSWRDIRTMRLKGSNEPPPHLLDVLSLAKELGVWCYLEPKEGSPILLRKIVDAIVEYDMTEQAVVLTFHWRRRLLKYVKSLNVRIKTNAIVLSPFGSLMSFAQLAAADMITCGWKGINHFRLLDPTGVRLRKKVCSARSHGLTLMGGYGDTQPDIEWLVHVGVDGIFTNNVSKVRNVLVGKSRTTNP